MAKLRVTIGPKGETKIESIGFAGQACLAATKSLEEALGKVVSEEKTGDYYKQEQAVQRLEN